jgi:hypothetical protein
MRRLLASIGSILTIGTIIGCIDTTNPGAPQRPSLKSVIHVSVRRSLLDSSTSVLQISNISQSPLPALIMSFTNLDSKHKQYYKIDLINPGEQLEIGMLEAGWAFEPNEEIYIAIENGQYVGVTLKTYRAENGSVGIKQKGLW